MHVALAEMERGFERKEGGETAQWELLVKAGGLSLILETHVVGERTDFTSLTATDAAWHVCPHPSPDK